MVLLVRREMRPFAEASRYVSETTGWEGPRSVGAAMMRASVDGAEGSLGELWVSWCWLTAVRTAAGDELVRTGGVSSLLLVV